VTFARFARRSVLLLTVTVVAVCCLAIGAFARFEVRTQTSLLPRSMGMLTMSCPSVDLCVAEGAGPSKGPFYTTMYSTHPSVGSSWKYLTNPPAPGGVASFSDNQITCPSTHRCLDIGDHPLRRGQPDSAVYAIQDFDQPHPRWKLVGGGFKGAPGPADYLSCPTAGFCAELATSQPARNLYGAFWLSAHPGAPGSWRQRPIPLNAYYLFCASARLCLADVHVEGGARLMSIRDPLSSSSRWHDYPLPLLGHSSSIQSASCSSSGTCIMLVDRSRGVSVLTGSILTTSNVEGGPSTWITSFTARHLRFWPLFSRGSCFANGSCYATAGVQLNNSQNDNLSNEDHELAFSADPGSGRASWKWIGAALSATCATPLTCFGPVPAPTFSHQAIETIKFTR